MIPSIQSQSECAPGINAANHRVNTFTPLQDRRARANIQSFALIAVLAILAVFTLMVLAFVTVVIRMSSPCNEPVWPFPG